MSSPGPSTTYFDGQATGGRRDMNLNGSPEAGGGGAVLRQSAGNLVKGATNEDGNLKDAALLLGIKLDLDAEIHLTARVKGDITVGLY